MALVRNIEEVRNHLPTTVAQSIENLDTYIALAEQSFIIPEVGAELYTYIHDKYNSNTVTSDKDKELLNLLQKAVTFYAYMLYIPVGQLQISDSGIRIAVSESLKTAFDWQIDDLETSFKDAGDISLELVLQFLHKNLSDYASYSGSAAFLEYKKLFISTADQFNLRCSVQLSHRVFKKLRMDLLMTQTKEIDSTLGTPFYADMLNKWKQNTLTGIRLEILEKIQFAMANLALSNSIKSLTVGVNDLGINTSTNSIFKQKVKTPATDNQLSQLMEKLTNDGNYWLGQLKKLLDANRNDLPLYADAFPITESSSSVFIENKIENGIYTV